ncbi:MAG: polysaccharide deacetylase family protein [Candidatus Nomurabacteria bacterium]|jgi:peptidoglycan/xylan/chitin deacetylase (PgdA/CDA1 family)|nr:polysaccharide deacetylase family protein [Candidatus Nomurabacteria bacterium]
MVLDIFSSTKKLGAGRFRLTHKRHGAKIFGVTLAVGALLVAGGFIAQNIVSAANYNITPYSTLDEFENGWTLNGAQSANTPTIIQNNADQFKTGTGALKITADSGNVVVDKTVSLDMSATNTLSYWLYIPTQTDLSQIYNIALYFFDSGSTFFMHQSYGTALHIGWNNIIIPKSSIATTTGASWNNPITRLRVRLNVVIGSTSPTFFIDNMQIGGIDRPKVLFTFDDGWDSQYSEGFQYMKSKGLTGTAYMIGDKVDTSGYMTSPQAAEMYNAGWDLGVHGATALTTLGSVADQKNEIQLNQKWLTDRGYTCAANHYAYPNGAHNTDSLTALQDLGFQTARTIIDRNQAGDLDEPLLLTRQQVRGDSTPAAIKTKIDNAVASGTTIILNYHRIVATVADNSMEVSVSDFREIVDYAATLAGQGDLDVMTISDWYNGLVGAQSCRATTGINPPSGGPTGGNPANPAPGAPNTGLSTELDTISLAIAGGLTVITLAGVVVIGNKLFATGTR